jgi:hypothetical protein
MNNNGAQKGRHGDHDHTNAKEHANVGYDARVGGHNLCQQKKKQKKGREYVHAEYDLGWCLGRQPEDDHGENGEQNARIDEQIGVEGRVTFDNEIVGEHRVVLVVLHAIALCAVHGLFVNDPLLARLVVAQVERLEQIEHEIDETRVVGPRAERQRAVLHVKWKELEVNLTGTKKERSRYPEHVAGGVHDQQSLALVLQPLVGRVQQHNVMLECKRDGYANDLKAVVLGRIPLQIRIVPVLFLHNQKKQVRI